MEDWRRRRVEVGDGGDDREVESRAVGGLESTGS